MAVAYARRTVALQQSRTFASVTRDVFTGRVLRTARMRVPPSWSGLHVVGGDDGTADANTKQTTSTASTSAASSTTGKVSHASRSLDRRLLSCDGDESAR